jgi:hypothetical protein
MIKRLISVIFLLCVLGGIAAAQDVAARRAETMGIGMNVSYLDNWWNGSKDKHFSDFAKPQEAAKREKMFADIAAAGFKTVSSADMF